MFLASSGLQLAMSAIGVLVFTRRLTVYGTQWIKDIYVGGETEVIAGKKAIMTALALYLHVLHLFLMVIQLLGDGRRE